MSIRTAATVVVGLLILASPLEAQETISRGGKLSVDIAHDGRTAIDLAGDIWIVPPGGGKAEAITRNLKSVQRPRWSPDASEIAYQAFADGSQALWIYNFAKDESRKISRGKFLDLYPAWHPDGKRLIYASDSTGTGLDLWEVDLPTGLHWRLTDKVGDETEPAWSSDGQDLVYVHHDGDQWSLILRERGLPEETLLSTSDRIAAPSWRPDGSLITFVRKSASESSIEMVILSRPRLLRPYIRGESFVLSPVSWLDRHRMLYTADGTIHQRLFNSWTSSPLPFRATMLTAVTAASAKTGRRRLPTIAEPDGRLVIHASRMFDGLGGGYQTDRDIIIDRGRITAVEPHSDRPGTIVVDMGDLTVLPGYIDALGDLSAAFGKRDRFDDSIGPLLLTTGVTTLVAPHADAERLNALWSGKHLPGPRLLNADDWPAGPVSGLADSMTPGLQALLQSRQAGLIGVSAPVARRFADPPSIDAGVRSVVLGSKQNGLPPGIALHAELLALAAAGLRPEQSLRAAGVNAAAALRLDPLLGRIAVGASADLVFVDGDPLSNIEDARKIVAVVRNGRFFSVSGLIDRVKTAESVE
ncbi:MAG: PD40 domain-containing protein [Gammaproteobacteria bacterium]|nr:PD40 domain-containing protein [Gammaproteobacteria bacterium]MBT8110756.1 PD40 domain-containing protein [Gammaproteobacteria bacterium]NND46631.1 amidohydrolase family protein [Woeseiaceae bacterium]NNL45455.1 amidohydrolase family protein [Woeseiaceae bacterium]